jgi:hypothetical protein
MPMNLKEIEPPECQKFIGYLEALSERIRIGEVFWQFEIRLFECENKISNIRELIEYVYPGAKVDKAEIIEGSVEDMRKTFEHWWG